MTEATSPTALEVSNPAVAANSEVTNVPADEWVYSRKQFAFFEISRVPDEVKDGQHRSVRNRQVAWGVGERKTFADSSPECESPKLSPGVTTKSMGIPELKKKNSHPEPGVEVAKDSPVPAHEAVKAFSGLKGEKRFRNDTSIASAGRKQSEVKTEKQSLPPKVPMDAKRQEIIELREKRLAEERDAERIDAEKKAEENRKQSTGKRKRKTRRADRRKKKKLERERLLKGMEAEPKQLHAAPCASAPANQPSASTRTEAYSVHPVPVVGKHQQLPSTVQIEIPAVSGAPLTVPSETHIQAQPLRLPTPRAQAYLMENKSEALPHLVCESQTLPPGGNEKRKTAEAKKQKPLVESGIGVPQVQFAPEGQKKSKKKADVTATLNVDKKSAVIKKKKSRSKTKALLQPATVLEDIAGASRTPKKKKKKSGAKKANSEQVCADVKVLPSKKKKKKKKTKEAAPKLDLDAALAKAKKELVRKLDFDSLLANKKKELGIDVLTSPASEKSLEETSSVKPEPKMEAIFVKGEPKVEAIASVHGLERRNKSSEKSPPTLKMNKVPKAELSLCDNPFKSSKTMKPAEKDGSRPSRKRRRRRDILKKRKRADERLMASLKKKTRAFSPAGVRGPPVLKKLKVLSEVTAGTRRRTRSMTKVELEGDKS